MSACEPKKFPRPRLCGLFDHQVKRNLTMTGAITIGGCLLFYVFYNLRRQRQYAEYYKKDMDKEFECMVKTGVFDSCRK